MTADESAALEAELLSESGMSLAEWADLDAQSPEDRAMLVDARRALGKLSWTAEPTRTARIEAILGVFAAVAAPIAVVAGGVTGFAGAIAAVKAL